MLGAEPQAGGVRYCVWAPECAQIEVEISRDGEPSRVVAMERQSDGYHRAVDPGGQPGDRYRFRLDRGSLFPDPAARAQAADVHGASVVVDAAAYAWRDRDWKRPPFRDLVIYELHVGTFTPEGTFRAAIDKLPHLQRLGVNALELMPIADFPGDRSWGYDGVLIYAPARAYGTPDDLRALVDAAHAAGIAVILDVVYNHFGPDGNYLSQYSSHFFDERHQTPWGAGLNFDGEKSEPVRDFFVSNINYWMEQYHIDGFRLDATHAIIDKSERHIFAEITEAIHRRGGYAIAEDSRNEARLLLSKDDRGYDFDGVWADDFHHVVRVGQTGQREAYFKDFEGELSEMVSTLRHGWLYRGNYSAAAERNRGTECRHLPPSKFVHCLSNHDQTGNRAFGERLSHTIGADAYRALSVLICLTPYTPMLFMGQEWAASTPFQYFTDHNKQLGPLITEGRRREFADFAAFRDPAARQRIPDPQAAETFTRSKLQWSEVEEAEHAAVMSLYAECLRLRSTEPLFRPQSRDTWEVDELALGVGAIRFGHERTAFLLLFDLWGGHRGGLKGERLAHAKGGAQWQLILASNEKRFGGDGTPAFDEQEQSCDFRVPTSLVLRLAS